MRLSVVYILWLRQIKRFFRKKSRIIGSIGQPLLFLVALGLGFGPVFERAGEGSYLQFLVPGIVAMSILFSGLFAGIEIIWDRQFGFLKETLVAPVSRFSIVIGRTLGGATVATGQGIVVLLIAGVAGYRIERWDLLLPVILMMFLIAVMFTGLGTAIASLMEDMQGFQLVMNFVVMPLFFLSGAIFPLQDLPGPVLFIARLNPLSYGVDGLRGLLGGVSEFGLSVDFIVLGVITAAAFAIGSYLFSKIQL